MLATWAGWGATPGGGGCGQKILSQLDMHWSPAILMFASSNSTTSPCIVQLTGMEGGLRLVNRAPESKLLAVASLG